jgi:hypothetical protein
LPELLKLITVGKWFLRWIINPSTDTNTNFVVESMRNEKRREKERAAGSLEWG